MPHTIGLIAAGAASQSFLARLPFVRERLGPVYSSALRVASRIVNGLRTGVAVPDLQAFSNCSIVLITVPEDALDTAIEGAASAGIDWHKKTVVLCESARDSSSLAPLQRLGAHTASLDVVPATGETRFVAEGDPPAIADLRRLFGRARLLVLDPGGKAAYQAGLLLASDLILEMTALAVDALRAAGLTRPQAVPVVEAVVMQSVRSYAKGGRRAAEGLPSRQVLARYAKALHARDPELARMFLLAIELGSGRIA